MVETDVTAPLAVNGDRPPLPAFVKVNGAPRFSANQLRVIKAATGLSLEAVMGDGASVMQAYAWLELRKAGYDLTYDEAGDVELEFGDSTPDPTSAGIVTASPHSAGSGE